MKIKSYYAEGTNYQTTYTLKEHLKKKKTNNFRTFLGWLLVAQSLSFQ